MDNLNDILKNITNKFISKTEESVRTIPIDFPDLNSLLGSDGLPQGKIIEIYGKESIGKTTLALMIAQKVQQRGLVLFVDTEYSFDKQRAIDLGIDTSELVILFPPELPSLLSLIKDSVFDLIIIDSFTNFEINNEYMKQLKSTISSSNSCLIFTNQIREDIKKRKTVSSGTKINKFYFDISLEIYKKEKVNKDTFLNIRCLKNLVGPVNKEVKIQL